MKIGILTYHRAHNYGAILQAIATRVVLEKLGHEVYYVDYWPEYHKNMYNVFSFDKFKKFGWTGKINYLRLLFTKSRKIRIRIDNFMSFINEHVSPYCKSVNESFDMIVIGSDQVWRYQGALNDYNPVYFGNNSFSAKCQVTYAASMGILPNNPKDKERIKELVSSLQKISVRENDLKNILNELGIKAEVHLDPTLLLSKKDWDKIIPPVNIIDKPYLLYYNFQKGAFKEEEIRQFANKYGLEVKSIVGGVRQKEALGEQNTAGPLEFLQLIRNARFVFTSSFHGLAFSLIFNKQFYASYTHNSGRAQSILEVLGLQYRLLSPNCSIPINTREIDYEKVNESIDLLKKNSIDYLSHLSI